MDPDQSGSGSDAALVASIFFIILENIEKNNPASLGESMKNALFNLASIFFSEGRLESRIHIPVRDIFRP